MSVPIYLQPAIILDRPLKCVFLNLFIDGDTKFLYGDERKSQKVNALL